MTEPDPDTTEPDTEGDPDPDAPGAAASRPLDDPALADAPEPSEPA